MFSHVLIIPGKVAMIDRKNFKRQVSDNMDTWKKQRWKSQRDRGKRQNQKKKDADARKNGKVARHPFSNDLQFLIKKHA